MITKALASVGKGILWLGRLMFANPILVVIGLIAMAAIYIWQNWDTLGPKFKAMWDAICGYTAAAWDWIKEKASAGWEGIKSLFFNYTLPGLVAKNWDAIKAGVSEAWSSVRQFISDKWTAIQSDAAALPAKFQDMGSAIIDNILNGINAKWEALKSKLSSVTEYLPDWMTGNNKTPAKTGVQVVGSAAAAVSPSGIGFAGMYDSGGTIPRGQFGIVGENGPEIVNGPANVTSRRRTAELARVAAGISPARKEADRTVSKVPDSPVRQVEVLQPASVSGLQFAGMFDTGGVIPRGQFGIVGENGPEIVNGPANVTSRRRTAELASVVAGINPFKAAGEMNGRDDAATLRQVMLASVVAGVLGVSAAPVEAAPVHPYSLPAKEYRQPSGQAQPAAYSPHYEIHAPITIVAQPGQSAQDIAREVARQLDERMRRAEAKARSNYSDQGGYES